MTKESDFERDSLRQKWRKEDEVIRLEAWQMDHRPWERGAEWPTARAPRVYRAPGELRLVGEPE
jgi:hypothetical protein